MSIAGEHVRSRLAADIESDCMFWSPQVDEFLGIPPVQGHKTQRGLLALVHPDDREAMARGIRQVTDLSRTEISFQHRVKKSDGMMLSCIWTGHIIRDHSGKALHVLGTVRAITGRPESGGGARGARPR